MNLDPALKLAVEEFKKIDLKDVGSRSGADVTPDRVQIDYRNHKYLIRLPEVEWEGDVSVRTKLVILHYLNNSKVISLSDKLIDFREIPGGNFYYPVFETRVHRPFLKYFGKMPTLLLKASLPLNGKEAGFGDFSVSIPTFPYISVVFVIHQGDEEFPPSAKILFNSTVSNYLSAEDIVVMCEDVCMQLIKNTR